MKKTIIIIIMTLFINSAVISQINPFVGTERADAVEFVIGNEVYVGLGNNSTDGNFNDFWKYSSTTDKWEQVATFPGIARYSTVAFTLNGKGYVGLGQSENKLYHDDFYCYDPSNNTWTAVSDFEYPSTDAVSFVIDGYAYVGTGYTMINNGSENEYAETQIFWKYDPVNDTWTEIAPLDDGERYSATAFSINGKGYVTGGIHYDGYVSQLSDVQEYDPATNKWKERIYADGINLSFSSASAFSYNGKGYICYGNKEKIVSYDPSTNRVEDLGDFLGLEEKRYTPITFVLGGKAYLGLGSFGWTTTYMNDILEIPFDYGTLSSNDIFTNDISIYPNPVKSKLYVNAVLDTEITEIFLYSTNGKRIDLENKKIIDLSGVNSGIYIINIKTNDTFFKQRIFVE